MCPDLASGLNWCNAVGLLFTEGMQILCKVKCVFIGKHCEPSRDNWIDLVKVMRCLVSTYMYLILRANIFPMSQLGALALLAEMYCIHLAFSLQKTNPHTATYYTNRALCYIKLHQWALAVDDCQKAIQIDPTLIKAHFFMGQALTELENYDDAITALTKGEYQHKPCDIRAFIIYMCYASLVPRPSSACADQ